MASSMSVDNWPTTTRCSEGAARSIRCDYKNRTDPIFFFGNTVGKSVMFQELTRFTALTPFRIGKTIWLEIVVTRNMYAAFADSL